MIDGHSHLLPAIDDGSKTAEQSLRVFQRFIASGVHGVIFTPHTQASELTLNPAAALARRDSAYQVLQDAGVPSELSTHLGFEIMLDQLIPTDRVTDRRFSLAGSRYLLVEFPRLVVGGFAASVLRQIVEHGMVPLVAHPERYRVCTPETIRAWRFAGAKMQVDATTLTQSTSRGHRARQLVSQGLADILAADNHGGRRCLKTGFDFVVAHGAPAAAERLCVVNPTAIVEDQDMQPAGSVIFREGVLSKLKRFIGDNG